MFCCSNWDGFKDNYTVMMFSSGDRCWNGPDRSLRVTFFSYLNQIRDESFSDVSVKKLFWSLLACFYNFAIVKIQTAIMYDTCDLMTHGDITTRFSPLYFSVKAYPGCKRYDCFFLYMRNTHVHTTLNSDAILCCSLYTGEIALWSEN